jgi:hypothetical protein
MVSRICLALAGLLFCVHTTLAQEEEGEGGHRHKLALFSGSSWLPQGRSIYTGDRQTVIAPVYGLDYEFRVGERWAIGTYNDITLIRVAMEDAEGMFMERENAVLLSVGGSYELFPRMAVELSAGVETDRHETLRVGRLGLEYAIPLPQHWELAIAASYVNKDVFDVFSLGLLVGRRF